MISGVRFSLMKFASLGLVVVCYSGKVSQDPSRMGRVTSQPGFLQGCGVQDRSIVLLAPSECAAASVVSRQQAGSQAGSNFPLL